MKLTRGILTIFTISIFLLFAIIHVADVRANDEKSLNKGLKGLLAEMKRNNSDLLSQLELISRGLNQAFIYIKERDDIISKQRDQIKGLQEQLRKEAAMILFWQSIAASKSIKKPISKKEQRKKDE